MKKTILRSPAKKIGSLLTAEFENNPHFYFFSPDETTSNKFDQIFTVEKRAWNLPVKPWDLPESPNGRIVEMLSENVLFSVMTGHLMNGEPAMLGSYEAFLPICTAQILQHLKFIKQAKLGSWRDPIPAVNLLSTSTCWRQDHNGFTHQSPALISTLLDLPSNLSNCLFPADDLGAAAAYRFMIDSTNVVNITTFNKITLPRLLTPSLARESIATGVTDLSALSSDASGSEPDYSDTSSSQPDFILAAAGDLMAKEALAAAKILAEDLPEVKTRVIYISALSYRAIGTTDHKLSQADFNRYFTDTCPIIADFHGYPVTLANILAGYAASHRLSVHGYQDEGSTTTPFEMLRRNGASRYDLALDVAFRCGRNDLVNDYQQVLSQNHAYAIKYGEDLPELA